MVKVKLKEREAGLEQGKFGTGSQWDANVWGLDSACEWARVLMSR
jgi:hypothetical protein